MMIFVDSFDDSLNSLLNSSRVTGEVRPQDANVTLLYCDIFLLHFYVSIVEKC